MNKLVSHGSFSVTALSVPKNWYFPHVHVNTLCQSQQYLHVAEPHRTFFNKNELKSTNLSN